MPLVWDPGGDAAVQLEGCSVGRHDFQLCLGARGLALLCAALR